jgi:hypothetical protein
MDRNQLFKSALKAQKKIDALGAILEQTEPPNMRKEIERQIAEHRKIVNARTAEITKMDKKTE